MSNARHSPQPISGRPKDQGPKGYASYGDRSMRRIAQALAELPFMANSRWVGDGLNCNRACPNALKTVDIRHCHVLMSCWKILCGPDLAGNTSRPPQTSAVLASPARGRRQANWRRSQRRRSGQSELSTERTAPGRSRSRCLPTNCSWHSLPERFARFNAGCCETGGNLGA